MSRFQKNLDTAYAADFARTFRYRPLLKGSVTASATFMLLLALAYAVPGLRRLSAASDGERWLRALIGAAGVVSCAASVVTGFPALLSGQALTGTRLMIHVGTAPVFAACAVLVTLFWADRNRFGRTDWQRVRRPFGAAALHGAVPYAVVLRKLSFWIAVAAMIPAAASATAAMFPLLASVRQAGLFLVHRWSVVALSASAVVFAITALVCREP